MAASSSPGGLDVLAQHLTGVACVPGWSARLAALIRRRRGGRHRLPAGAQGPKQSVGLTPSRPERTAAGVRKDVNLVKEQVSVREGQTDTGEIERELNDTRSRLDDTIGALQRKVAPGTLVDQAVEYYSEGGGMEIGRNLGRSLRDNPIPVALIGVEGLGWLLLANSRQTNGGAQDGPKGDGCGTTGSAAAWTTTCIVAPATRHRASTGTRKLRSTSQCRTRRPRVTIW